MTLADSEQLLDPGDFALAIGGESHAFAGLGTVPAVFLAGFHPGVGLSYIREMAAIFGTDGPDRDAVQPSTRSTASLVTREPQLANHG